MKRPVIGVTRDSNGEPGPTDRHYPFYATSVEKAGGESLSIPYRADLSGIGELVGKLDGIVFSGGDDLDPALYGEAWHPQAKAIDPVRQRYELALLAEVERRGVPVLGICLGIQLMNVHRGGSLIQFLPDYPRGNALEHRKLEVQLRRHPVKIDGETILGKAVGKGEISANTYHKQAIGKLGRGLRATAWSPDGVVEGVEDPSGALFVGVQWHPERLNDEGEHLAIFKMLVEGARRAASSK